MDDLFVVEQNQIINDDIHITDYAVIKNYGIINGNIYVNDGVTAVNVENYGQINGAFNGNNSIVTQNIINNTGINKIEHLSGHIINVHDLQNINMTNLMYTAENAVQIELEDSSVIIDGSLEITSMPIVVHGNSVVFNIQGMSDSWVDMNTPLISNISGVPIINVSGIEPIYTMSPRLMGGALYLDLVRQTDYSEIISNPTIGEYVNNLQTTDPNNEMVAALNNANSMNEIMSIILRSVQFNPIRLMNPIKSIHSLELGDNIYDERRGLMLKPRYVLSRDFSYRDMVMAFTDRLYDNIVFKFGLNVGYGRFSDYTGTLYGGNIGARYDDSDYYIDFSGVVSYTSFRHISVLDGTSWVRNPNGIGATFALDGGIKLHAFENLFDISPFVGMRVDYARVVHENDTDVSARIGANLAYNTIVDGNNYSVGMRTYMQTDKVYYAGIYTDMLSTADSVSGGAGCGILYDDMGVSYQMTLNAKILF